MRNVAILLSAAQMMLLANASGQPLPIQVELDDAVFAYDEEFSLLELYMSFEARALPFERSRSGYLAELPLEVRVFRQSDARLDTTLDQPVWEDDSAVAFALADTSMLDVGQFFVHQVRLTIQPGVYEVRVRLPADSLRHRSEIEIRREVLVPDYFAESRAVLSDITLASELRPADERSNPFYKSGYVVRPNANQLFGQGLAQLFYYAEAYNTRQVAADDDRYTVYAYLSDANRATPVSGLEQRTRRTVADPDVLVGSFDVSEVPTGSYVLRLALLSEKNESLAESSHKVYVYNPGIAREQPMYLEETFEVSEYSEMPEGEVTVELDRAAVLASAQEQRRIRALPDLDAKRRFLMEFWRLRDPNPGSPRNEFKDEFDRRIEAANAQFSNSYRDGWQTDRGRVLVKYGQPSNIDPRLYERETIPHEIWEYSNIPGEGQAFFVFADRTSFGEFELIHSTVTGELSLPNWESELRK